MNTSLKKTLTEGVIAELGQFSVNSKKQVIYLRFIFNCCGRYLTHTKINGEYVIKIRCLHLVMRARKTSHAYKDKCY